VKCLTKDRTDLVAFYGRVPWRCGPTGPSCTTIPDVSQPCPDDKVNKEFVAQMPNQLSVSDFICVSSWQDMVHMVFVIDIFARNIVGWLVSPTMTAGFVLEALNQTIVSALRQKRMDRSIRSDRCSQYLAIKYTERLTDTDKALSVRSAGDSYDNALAESIIGLFKSEVIEFLGIRRNLARKPEFGKTRFSARYCRIRVL